MADRNSAQIFGDIFTKIAEYAGPIEPNELADFLWEESQKYDFTPDQMGSDESLIDLGFAKRSDVDGDEITVYRGDDEWT